MIVLTNLCMHQQCWQPPQTEIKSLSSRESRGAAGKPWRREGHCKAGVGSPDLEELRGWWGWKGGKVRRGTGRAGCNERCAAAVCGQLPHGTFFTGTRIQLLLIPFPVPFIAWLTKPNSLLQLHCYISKLMVLTANLSCQPSKCF